MQLAAVCTSHSPLLNVAGAAPAAIEQEIRVATAQLREVVSGFAPDLIVQFGDDHASAFSLSLMPAFCVGARAEALGDFETSSGRVLVPENDARALVEHLLDAGVDVAFSYRMTLDHGFVQALDLLLGGIDRVPVIPIMINCGGELRPPLWRARELGRAAGTWARSLGRRVLFLGSGGLSHDPPLPEFVGSPADVQQRLIAGVSYTPELLRERTQRVQRAGQDFARENALRLLPLNATWDREVLALFQRGALDEVAGWTDTAVRTAGGRGGAEIRNWLAALAALESAAGAYSCVTDFYRPVPELICGYAMMHAWPRTARPALAG